VEPCGGAVVLAGEQGRREAVVVNVIAKGAPLFMEVLIAAVGEIDHERIGVGELAVWNSQHHARRARDAGLRKGTLDRKFGTVQALRSNIDAMLYKPHDSFVVDWER